MFWSSCSAALALLMFRCSRQKVKGYLSQAHSLKRHQSTSSVCHEEGSYDIVIAGGGIMGCSSAYFLAKRFSPSSICIVERDTEYKRSSTVLSVGSIRQQFSIPGNTQMSMYSSRFIQDIAEHLMVINNDPPDVQFVSGGYLILASEQGVDVMRENFEAQRRQGAEVELLEPSQLKAKFPYMNTDGVALGSLGTRNEGWFDPWLLLSAFKKKIIAMGVHYIKGEVCGVDMGENRVRSVQVTSPQGHNTTLQCNHLVNAGGPWASQISLMAGVGEPLHQNPVMRIPLPVKPRRRCVFVFNCQDVPATDFPFIIDTNGVYLRREGIGGNTFICGMSPPEHMDKDGLDLEVDYSLFEEHMWPSLAHRVPACEALKLQSAWAGYYDYNTLDQNAIIGEHPVISNLIFANGFSGHGIQQSPAVGRAVSEIILDGHSHSIDLSGFSYGRIINNQPFKEKSII